VFDLDHWQEIWHTLKGNKVRTFLTAFGVFWGIFMLVVMLGSGNGLQNGVYREFTGIATNSFFVWTQRTSKPWKGLPAGRGFYMTNEDHAAIREQLPEARIVAPRNQLRGYGSANNVTRGARAGGFTVMGDYPEVMEVQAMRILEGRFVNHLDIEQRRKVAVIGRRIYDVLFERGEDPIGESIRINGVYFKVVGLFDSPRSGDQGDRDVQTIYLPFTTFQRAFNYGNVVGWFAITSQDDVPASTVERRVIALLKRRHRVAPDDERAFGHFNLEEEYQEIQGIFAGINGLIWIVGIGTLAAGVIGVSNIMLVVVRERTKEIGIRKSVGATPRSITVQVILEALILTAVAGYAGLMAGMWAIDLTNAVLQTSGAQPMMFHNPGVGLSTALQALAILVAAGILAGLIPAQRAVRVHPVEALRME